MGTHLGRRRFLEFDRAYPEARAFATLKARVDPGNRFRNLLWDTYL
jgi:FAD/FMN-containing dehydrogenase